MKPYYEDSAVLIYHCDCREVLPKLPKADLILTDPPYDKYTHERAATCAASIDNADFGKMPFEPLADINATAGLLLSATEKWALVFCAVEMLGRYQDARPDHYVRGGIWDRVSNSPQLSGDRPAQACEGIAIMHAVRKNMQWNGGGTAAIWRYMVERGMKWHETQKPLALMKHLVGLFSMPADLIVDPFMGSGSTLRAAKDLNRRGIGIEIEERYCYAAAKRMSQEVLELGV